jgi:hypothetical protein
MFAANAFDYARLVPPRSRLLINSISFIVKNLICGFFGFIALVMALADATN